MFVCSSEILLVTKVNWVHITEQFINLKSVSRVMIVLHGRYLTNDPLIIGINRWLGDMILCLIDSKVHLIMNLLWNIRIFPPQEIVQLYIYILRNAKLFFTYINQWRPMGAFKTHHQLRIPKTDYRGLQTTGKAEFPAIRSYKLALGSYISFIPDSRKLSTSPQATFLWVPWVLV